MNKMFLCNNFMNSELYERNKKNYILLKGGCRSPKIIGIHFVHNIWKTKNIKKILEDGVLKTTNEISINKRTLSGDTNTKYLYMNINFEDIDNLHDTNTSALIFDESLAHNYDFIFNTHWNGSPSYDSIFVFKDDNIKDKGEKIVKIKEYIENPTFYKNTPMAGKVSGIMTHEILFAKNIPIKNYLVKVKFNGTTTEANKIKKILKEKYEDVLFEQI